MSFTSQNMQDLLESLYPICRSITGDGVRESFEILSKFIDLNVKEYPSGQKCYDWEIPKEWNISDGFVENSAGQRVIDFKKNNLHVMGYSSPVESVSLSYDELVEKVHVLNDLPDAIPYRTSYYKSDWSFCASKELLESLPKDDTYTATIKSRLEDGNLTLADAILKGQSKEEILISSYVCHPSMCNDNLSGVIVAVALYNWLREKRDRHYTYRFVFVPETIGAVAYLANHPECKENVIGGWVLTTCGGPGPIGYKETFLGDSFIDKITKYVLSKEIGDYKHYPFVPDGSDERQYSSPGHRIPVATISKDKYYEYDYYHTSKDDLDFVNGDQMQVTFELYKKCVDILETNFPYFRREPHCEIQLGKRGLYPNTGGGHKQLAGSSEDFDPVDAICWYLFLCDGENDLIDISEKAKIPYDYVRKLTQDLLDKDVIYRNE